MNSHLTKTKKLYGVTTVVAALLLLSGCDWCCKKKSGASSSTVTDANDGSKVLLTIDGKAVITVKQFEEYYNQFLAANPRLQGMIQFLPNAKHEILQGMINEEIVAHWAKQNKIDQSSEYQVEYKAAMKMVERGLAAKNFEQKIVGKTTVTDDEVKAYYESHKDPELIVSPGGIKAMGVEFDSSIQAHAFLDKVRGKVKDFKSIASTSKYTIRDFGPINSMSFDVDQKVKAVVADIKTFPSAFVVEASNKKFWVIAAMSKEETKYRSLDEVRDGVKAAIEREKLTKVWTEKINEIKKQYNIVEDKTAFENEKQTTSAESMPLSQEELAAITQKTAAQNDANTVQAQKRA